jgi:hypothetical protein
MDELNELKGTIGGDIDTDKRIDGLATMGKDQVANLAGKITGGFEGSSPVNQVVKYGQGQVDGLIDNAGDQLKGLVGEKFGKWIKMYNALKNRLFTLASQAILLYIAIKTVIEFSHAEGAYDSFLNLFKAPLVYDAQLVDYSANCPSGYTSMYTLTMPTVNSGCRCDNQMYSQDKCNKIYKSMGSPPMSTFSDACSANPAKHISDIGKTKSKSRRLDDVTDHSATAATSTSDHSTPSSTSTSDHSTDSGTSTGTTSDHSNDSGTESGTHDPQLTELTNLIQL